MQLQQLKAYCHLSKNISPNIGDENLYLFTISSYKLASKNISPNIGDDDFWVELQRECAQKLQAELIELSCGHYIHHFKAEEIVSEIRKFLE